MVPFMAPEFTGRSLRWSDVCRRLCCALLLAATTASHGHADPIDDPRAQPSVRLEVEQTYVYRERSSITTRPIERLQLPLAEVAHDLLVSAGVTTSETNGGSGATLIVTAYGEALGGLLFGELDGFLYTGALIRGTVAFDIDGETAYSAAFAGRIERRRSLERNLGYEDPINAPFADALATSGSFYDRIAEAIGVVYGAPALIVAFDEADPLLRPFIARVLGDLGDRTAVPTLVDALADPDRGLRWQAAWSLGRLGDPLAVEPLIAVLGDRDQDVRWFAAWSLAEITGLAYGDDETAWRSWWTAQAGE